MGQVVARARVGRGKGMVRASIAAVLVAMLAVPALLAWLCYRALRLMAVGIVLLILWAIG